ncbi:MAG: SDR family oxidoreductase [Pararobbsia sp.]
MTNDRDNAFSLAGEIALVTGATRGLAMRVRAHSGRPVRRLRWVVETWRPECAGCGNAQARGERSRGRDGHAVPGLHFRMLFQWSSRSWVRFSVLVNNAGHSRPAAAMDVDVADYDSMFDLNVKGAFFASQAVARRMALRGRGAIINIASQAGLVALEGRPIYCMTKAAMIHMTQCLAVEWAKHHIRVNAVRPPLFAPTARKDGSRTMRRSNRCWRAYRCRQIGEPENVADPVVFLASKAAEMITGRNPEDRWRMDGCLRSIGTSWPAHRAGSSSIQLSRRP